LSDADPSVRSLALSTTITIFSSPTVPAAAKTDLKKEMYKLQVAKKVQDQILHAVLGPGEVGAVYGETTTTQSLKSPNSKPLPARAITSPRSQSSLPPLPSTAFPAENSQPLSNGSQSEVATIYIASEIDLRQEFSNMLEGFDGKETEFNWIIRDKNVGRIRGMLKGGIRRTPYSDDFLIGFKSVMDGVLKTVGTRAHTSVVCPS
jgi:CLIP-associating protein 1/2